jgi:hypothetical protein
MSRSPNPIPVQNARCPKGHDNPPGRQYCQQCGSKLATPPLEPRPPEPSQLERLQQSLDSSKSENQQLLQQIQALSTEIANLKENLAAQADKPHPPKSLPRFMLVQMWLRPRQQVSSLSLPVCSNCGRPRRRKQRPSNGTTLET